MKAENSSVKMIRAKNTVQTARSLPSIESIEPRLLFSGGNLDGSFNGNGQITSIPGVVDGSAVVNSTAIQRDEKVVVAGQDGGLPGTYFVSRFNKDGSPDTSFNGTGTLFIPRTSPTSPDIAIGSDGKIVLASGNLLARITTDGHLDPTFGGGDGMNNYMTENSLDGASIALRPDGKIIIAATNSDSVRRFFSNGFLDPAFGKNGVEFVDGNHQLNQLQLRKVVRQSDGSILAIGYDLTLKKVVVAKLLASGALDKSFGGGVGFVTPKLSSKLEANITTATLQTDGRLLLTGNLGGPGDDSTQTEYVARLKTDGSLDKSFDGDGIRTFVFSSHDAINSPEGVTSIAEKSDGRIVVAGSATQGSSVFAVMELNSSGGDYSSFGNDARTFVDLGADFSFPAEIAVVPDKKVVLVGIAETLLQDGSEQATPVVLRFN